MALKVGRNCLLCRCSAEDPSTRPRAAVPPPPPIPPPPPGNFKRREEANRRDAIRALVVSGGTCAAFLFARDFVKAPIDRKPRMAAHAKVVGQNWGEEEEVTTTRVKRNEKGQPFVQGSDGDWLLVRASSQTAGMLYLRDSIGRIYRLAIADRVQVDLAEDGVLLELFGDGEWENKIEQLTKNDNEVLISEEEFLRIT